MNGAFNDYIGADVETTRVRNAQKGQCVYYRRGLCGSECKPRCVDYAAGACASFGVCVTRHYYRIPPGIIREELVSV